MASDQPLYNRDLDLTMENKRRLQKNSNLLFWYQQLFQQLFSEIGDCADKRVLEIGSGASPLSLFYPNVMTSDVLALDHLDHVFDCHELDHYDGIPDRSIDIIVLTNVLHHLRDPLMFLQAASKKLSAGGNVYLVEPYFSVLSYPLYKLLHHEPVNFGIDRPILDRIEGPLSTSNQAIPYMIFFSRPEWQEVLTECYDLKRTRLEFFSGLSYFLTGGISRVFPIPPWLYRKSFALDYGLAKLLPRMLASFFVAKMQVAKKS